MTAITYGASVNLDPGGYVDMGTEGRAVSALSTWPLTRERRCPPRPDAGPRPPALRASCASWSPRRTALSAPPGAAEAPRPKPSNDRWTGLDLSYADLSGADLSGADFAGSSLMYATLDNVDLSGADLTGCDLTGVRLEEPAPVIGVAPGRTDGSVIACYGDGTIREWSLGGPRLVPRKLLDGLSSLRYAAYGPYGDLIVIDGPRLSLWSITESGPVQNGVFAICSGTEHIRFTNGTVSFSRTDENQRLAMSVDCRAAAVAASVDLEHPGPVAFAADKTAAMTPAANVAAVVWLSQVDSMQIDVTAIDVRHQEPDLTQLVVGDSKGQVTSVQVTANGAVHELSAQTTQHMHEGPVLSAAFLTRGLAATGGIDRSLTICEWASGQLRVLDRLKLTLRCAGVKTADIQGTRERHLLEALRDRAEEADARS